MYVNVGGVADIDTVGVRAWFGRSYVEVRKSRIVAVEYSDMVSLAIYVSQSIH